MHVNLELGVSGHSGNSLKCVSKPVTQSSTARWCSLQPAHSTPRHPWTDPPPPPGHGPACPPPADPRPDHLKRPSVSRPSRSSVVSSRISPGWITSSSPFRPGFWITAPHDDVLVDMSGVDASAGEPHTLVLQRVASVAPAAGYAGVTIGRYCLFPCTGGVSQTGV